MTISTSSGASDISRKDPVYYNNIIAFPKRKVAQSSTSQVVTDPDLVITTEDGRALDKIGMAGSECCYILPPHVTCIHFQSGVGHSEARGAEGIAQAMPVRVILSESAAVTEIAVWGGEAGQASLPETGETCWIEPGRTLYLARQAPDYVAMLSVEFATSPPTSRCS